MPEFTHSRMFPGGGVLRLVLSIIGSGVDRSPSGRSPLPPLDRPGPRERPTQVSPRPAGCSRPPVNATGLRVNSCTRPPRPRRPRHLHPLTRMKAVEAWRRRAEGRGRCRCVRSSPRGAIGGATGVEALVLVMDEDTGPAARWGQPLRAQLRRRRWVNRLRRQLSVATACWVHPREGRLRRWRLVGRLRRRSRLAER